ncbi:MAG: hypothetical protein QME05_06760 [Candidatus Margulisbacteria bacterium]|nr:hypothetical protein [Candidatus Margulisiibacteriota bacterium]
MHPNSLQVILGKGGSAEIKIPLSLAKGAVAWVRAGTYAYKIVVQAKSFTLQRYDQINGQPIGKERRSPCSAELFIGRQRKISRDNYCLPDDRRLSRRHFSVAVRDFMEGRYLTIKDQTSKLGTGIEFELGTTEATTTNVEFLRRTPKKQLALCGEALPNTPAESYQCHLDAAGRLSEKSSEASWPVNFIFSMEGRITGWDLVAPDFPSEMLILLYATMAQYNQGIK